MGLVLFEGVSGSGIQIASMSFLELCLEGSGMLLSTSNDMCLCLAFRRNNSYVYPSCGISDIATHFCSSIPIPTLFETKQVNPVGYLVPCSVMSTVEEITESGLEVTAVFSPASASGTNCSFCGTELPCLSIVKNGTKSKDAPEAAAANQ